MIGTGAISHKHAQAYKNIGFELTVCTDINAEAGRRFASQWGVEFVGSYEDVCRHPKGVLHGLEAIEESVVVEIKSPAPDIGAFFATRA